MQVKNHFLILLSLTLLLISSCAKVPIYDTKGCVIKGTLDNGMMCSTMLTSTESELNFNQTIDFLQADEVTGKGPAICQSSKDWIKMKTSLEKACLALKDRCTPEQKESIKKFGKFFEKVIKKFMKNSENLLKKSKNTLFGE